MKQYYFFNSQDTVWSDNFEDTSLLTNATSPAQYTVDASGTYTGTKGLRRSDATAGYKQIWNPVWIAPPVKMTLYVRTDPGYNVTGLTGISFGIATSGGISGIQALVDVRQPGNNIQIRTDNNNSNAKGGVGIPSVAANVWYRIEVIWLTTSVNMKLFVGDQTTEIGNTGIIANDQLGAYALGGYVGVTSYSLGSFDNFKIERL